MGEPATPPRADPFGPEFTKKLPKEGVPALAEPADPVPGTEIGMAARAAGAAEAAVPAEAAADDVAGAATVAAGANT